MAKTARSGICDRLCPQPCHEQEYVTEKAFALWPRESFYKTSHETWENSSYSEITNLSFEKAKTNLLKLEVYFKVSKVYRFIEVQLEVMSITVSNVI